MMEENSQEDSDISLNDQETPQTPTQTPQGCRRECFRKQDSMEQREVEPGQCVGLAQPISHRRAKGISRPSCVPYPLLSL